MQFETSDIIKKVRRIEIKTRGLTRQIFSGQYHSAFRGKGIIFSEVREYQYGDDIRSIDWNVTARLNHPFVKLFDEERELTVMLLIDVSGSNEFGTENRFKEEMMTEIAAVLAFSAINNNDKVGVIFFSDRVEKFITPKKGTTHILRIIRELIDFKPKSQRTDIAEALRYLNNTIKKRAVVFILSDFLDSPFEESLRISARKHDVVSLCVYDRRERNLPPLGLTRFYNKETGKYIWIDSSSKRVRDNYKLWWEQHDERIRNIFRKAGVDYVSIHTGEDFVKPLMYLFKQREARR